MTTTRKYLSFLLGGLMITATMLPLAACTEAAATQLSATSTSFKQTSQPMATTVAPSQAVTTPYPAESILKPENWPTFDNYDAGFSIRYPPAYAIKADVISNDWTTIYDDRNATVINIGRIFNDIPGGTPSKRVDNTEKAFRDYFIYRVISRTDLMWQGLYPACEWTNLVQSCADIPPSTKEKHLYLMHNSYFYQINAWAAEPEYGTYSSIFDAVIASFRIIS
jgi:hypothetical protein